MATALAEGEHGDLYYGEARRQQLDQAAREAQTTNSPLKGPYEASVFSWKNWWITAPNAQITDPESLDRLKVTYAQALILQELLVKCPVGSVVLDEHHRYADLPGDKRSQLVTSMVNTIMFPEQRLGPQAVPIINFCEHLENLSALQVRKMVDGPITKNFHEWRATVGKLQSAALSSFPPPSADREPATVITRRAERVTQATIDHIATTNGDFTDTRAGISDFRLSYWKRAAVIATWEILAAGADKSLKPKALPMFPDRDSRQPLTLEALSRPLKGPVSLDDFRRQRR